MGKKQKVSRIEVTEISSTKIHSIKIYWWAALASLSGLIFICYFPIWRNGFTFDDQAYIVENEAIRDFSAKGIAHVFSYFEQGNYHPLTMLTYMIEFYLVGLKPWLYHLDNLLLHLANSYLIFIILKHLSKNEIIAYFTAMFFAVHPMHVESVAWASERKDVLYVFFFLLSFLYYLKNNETQKSIYYLLSIFFFMCSILSKGMAVVLPAILLVTDLYFLNKPLDTKLLFNKLPYFLLTIIFSIISINAQKTAGADFSTIANTYYSSTERFILTIYGFCYYWLKSILPVNLLAFYPYPIKVNNNLPTTYYLSLVVLILIVVGIYLQGKKDQRVWWGGLFFLISISTVLQIIPIGNAIVADRYFYLSSIGVLFLMALIISKIKNKILLYGTSAIVILLFCGLTFKQIPIWKNNLTLFTPVLEKYPNDPKTLSNIGYYYYGLNDITTAKEYLQKAIDNNMNTGDAFATLGSIYLNENNYATALNLMKKAIAAPPVKSITYAMAALASEKTGDQKEAKNYLDAIKSIDNFKGNELVMAGNCYIGTGHLSEGKILFQKALAANPNDLGNRLNLSFVLIQEHDLSGAVQILEKIIQDDPNYLNAYRNIGQPLIQLGQWEKAVKYWEKAAEFEPSGLYEYNIGILYAQHNNLKEANSWYVKAAKKGFANAKLMLQKNGVKE